MIKKQIDSLLAGFKSVLALNGYQDINTYFIGSEQDLKGASFPALIFDYGSISTAESGYGRKSFVDDNGQTVIQSTLVLSAKLLAFSEDQPLESAEILSICQAGYPSELFQSTASSNSKKNMVQMPALQAFDNIVRADSIEEDQHWVYSSTADLRIELVNQIVLSRLPCLGKNRVDQNLTFAISFDGHSTSVVHPTKLKISFLNASNKYKIEFETAPADQPISILITDDKYPVTKSTEKIWLSPVITNSEDIVTSDQLTQKINIELASKKFLFEFDSFPKFVLKTEGGQKTHTATVTR